jgi:hypothetical protein
MWNFIVIRDSGGIKISDSIRLHRSLKKIKRFHELLIIIQVSDPKKEKKDKVGLV